MNFLKYKEMVVERILLLFFNYHIYFVSKMLVCFTIIVSIVLLTLMEVPSTLYKEQLEEMECSLQNSSFLHNLKQLKHMGGELFMWNESNSQCSSE